MLSDQTIRRIIVVWPKGKRRGSSRSGRLEAKHGDVHMPACSPFWRANFTDWCGVRYEQL